MKLNSILPKNTLEERDKYLAAKTADIRTEVHDLRCPCVPFLAKKQQLKRPAFLETHIDKDTFLSFSGAFKYWESTFCSPC